MLRKEKTSNFGCLISTYYFFIFIYFLFLTSKHQRLLEVHMLKGRRKKKTIDFFINSDKINIKSNSTKQDKLFATKEFILFLSQFFFDKYMTYPY